MATAGQAAIAGSSGHWAVTGREDSQGCVCVCVPLQVFSGSSEKQSRGRPQCSLPRLSRRLAVGRN